MEICNGTNQDIIIINGSEEILCKSNKKINFGTYKDEVYIKSAEEKSLLSHFKIFKHLGKGDSVKGNVIYFNPGFYNEYVTKLTMRSDVKEINITKFDLTIHSLLLFSVFLPKEKLDKEICFENDSIRKLLLFFISLFAVPCCGVSGFFTLICACGIIFDFDWTLVVATLISAAFLLVFVGISLRLYRCANPSKNYAKNLEDGKPVIIRKNKKHFLSFVEEECAAEELKKIK